MADPLSIASGALAVITATTQTFSLIVKFIRDCQDARADLNQITRELLDLTLILELVKGESAEATENRLPHRLQSLVHTILKHCTATVQQIEVALDKCRGKPGPLLWTIYEKEKVASLKLSLEATKNSLNIALETVNISTIRDIKDMIQDDAAEIKHGISEIQRSHKEILDEIYRLRNQLPSSYQLDQGQKHERRRLEQWLDTLTQYAETIVPSEESMEVLDAASLLVAAEERKYINDRTTSRASNPTPPETSGGLVESRLRPRAKSRFPVLEAYDPDWRKNFGYFLNELGMGDDFIEADQDFIVDFLESKTATGVTRQDPVIRKQPPRTATSAASKHSQNKHRL
ncbi:hypothetical protein F4823DRAFT_249030 [Ustulina deusta]|nr:hypothetical protein F4823DRAFT_249030 [Ustulina deusta]